MKSIASKQVTPNEQGKEQGCISGISSLANIISPLIFSPLTDDCLCSECYDKTCSSNSQDQQWPHGRLATMPENLADNRTAYKILPKFPKCLKSSGTRTSLNLGSVSIQSS